MPTLGRWLPVRPVPGSVLIYPGDALASVSRGVYRAVPHRVRAPTSDRMSFTILFGGSWDAQLREIPMNARVRECLAHAGGTDGAERFLRPENESIADISTDNTYADYFLAKIGMYYANDAATAPPSASGGGNLDGAGEANESGEAVSH